MKLRAEIKNQAKLNFAKQYWVSVGAFVLIVLCMCAVSVFTSMDRWGGMGRGIGPYMGLSLIIAAISVFLVPPLIVAYASFTMRIYNDETGEIGPMFGAGFKNYWHHVGGILFMELFTFLWTLLFIVPGIIKAIAYSMTPYILTDLPNVTPTQALKVSMKMTKGYKGEIFVMYLSFIGWGILTALTCGILGIFYTGPYMSTSLAGLYVEIKKNALEKGMVTAQELGI